MSRRAAWSSLVLVLAACGGSTRSPSAVTPPAPSPTPVAPLAARYVVTFEATWSAATHPRDFPRSPHFSGLIGGTHRAAVRFWEPGALASEGIKLMAERGRQTPLDLEVGAAIAAGTAQHVLAGGDVPRSPGAVSLEFEITRDFPLVTLVTMVAPSPDWFVGVSGLPLFENGAWVEERVVALLPYDAGTDSGPSFGSPDEPTVPPQPIARISEPPLAEASGTVAPMGRFVFRRIS